MIAFPFDSRILSYDADGMPIYDRVSNAEHFAKLLSSFLCNGIFGSEMCEVLVDTGMSVTVGKGNALIEGRFAYLEVPETLTVQASEGYSRIDTVVLRRDLSSDVNFIVADIVKGTAASNPTRPALTRDGTVWELGLADILVPANSTAVSQANITDTRLENARCGLVAAILTDVDTTYLYEQISADLASFKSNEQADFEAWFETIQGLLEGDVAANLAGEIADLQQEVDDKIIGVKVTIPTSGWSGNGPYTQSIAVEKVSSDAAVCHVIMSYDPEYETEFNDAVVKVTEQQNGYLVFSVENVPETSFLVNVLLAFQGVSEE